MAAITFSYVLHSHKLADGTQKILLRITQNRKHKYVDIGYAIKAEDWNKEKKEVRRTHRLYNEIQMVMRKHLIEAQQTYLKNQSQDLPTSAGEIKRILKKELVGDSYLDYADEYVNKMQNAGSQGVRISILKKLRDYLGKDLSGKQNDLLFPEIDYKFLRNYERHLKRLGNGKNTIHGNIKFIRTVYVDAINTRHFQNDG